LANDGSVVVNAGATTGTLILTATDTIAPTIQGTGTLTLSGGALVTPLVEGNTLSLVGQTVAGYGRLAPYALNNQGTIRSNVAGKSLSLSLVGSISTNAGMLAADLGALSVSGSVALTNSGSITAATGASVTLNPAQFVQTVTGVLRSAGGSIYLKQPLTLTSDNGISFTGTSGSITVAGLDMSGRNLDLPSGSVLHTGPLTNTGGSLSTGGNVTFSLANNQGGAVLLNGNASGTLTAGGVGGPTIVSNNAGGVISLADNAHLTISDHTTVVGGTLASSGNASFSANGLYWYSAPTLMDVTIAGVVNAGQVNFGGTLTVNSQLNVTGGYQYALGPTLTLAGIGVTNFKWGHMEPPVSGTGTYQTVVATEHTVRGYGWLFYNVAGGQQPSIVNHGTIEAIADPNSAPGQSTFSLGGRQVTSDGTLRAMTGARLYFRTPDFTSTGTVEVQAGGRLQLASEGGDNGTYAIASIVNAGAVTVSDTAAMIDSLTGPGSLLVTYFGSATIGTLDGGPLQVDSPGSLTLAPSVAPARVTSLTLSGPLTLRAGRMLLVDYAAGAASPASTVRAYLKSSRLIASPPPDANYRLGYAETSMLPAGSPVLPIGSGTEADTTTLMVTMVLTGDANFSGSIDADDYALLDRAFSRQLADAHWWDGDFNFDGTVNSADYLLIDVTLAATHGGMLEPELLSRRQAEFGDAYVGELLAAVPEPGAGAGVVVMAVAIGLRRRRNGMPGALV
jgi:hypothetical protein